MKKYLFILMLLTPQALFAQGAEVIRIVDGDTVVVRFDNQEEKVRIIGINTPESVDPRRPVECFGKEASAHAKALLSRTSEITLENHNSRDRHGRMLAYIRLDDGADFGEKMIRDGYAYAYRSYSHDRMTEYIKTERVAKQAESGLWAPDTCLDDPITQEIIIKDRISFWENVYKIFKQLVHIFF